MDASSTLEGTVAVADAAQPTVLTDPRPEPMLVLQVPAPDLDDCDMLLEVRRSPQARCPVRLVASGELCAFTAPYLLDHLDGWDSDDVVLDLRAVTFIDCGGVSGLLELRRRWSDRGRTMVLCDPSAVVCRLVAALDLADVMFGAGGG